MADDNKPVDWAHDKYSELILTARSRGFTPVELRHHADSARIYATIGEAMASAGADLRERLRELRATRGEVHDALEDLIYAQRQLDSSLEEWSSIYDE